MTRVRVPLWVRWLCYGLLALGGLPPRPVQAQAAAERAGRPEVSLLPAPATVPVTGYFTLAFRLRGAALGDYSEFPDIEGFKKSGRTSTTTTRIVQGRRFTELTITQRYAPYGEGDYVIKPFQLTVNGVTVRSPGGTVHVGPPGGAPPGEAAAAPDPADEPLQAVGSLDQLFGKPKAALYQEPPDHAFLAVVADEPQVFVGEGVRVGLYFYLTPSDQALLAFHDFNRQVPDLLRQLHQPTTWEVPAGQPSIRPDSIRRGGQTYLRFRLAESTYYPLNDAPLYFPPLTLTMTKFKLLKKPEPGVDNRLATYKAFTSPAVRVRVRALPPRPDGAVVPVGDYRLVEAASRSRFQVGQSFTYTFGVEGRGNLAAVLPPVPAARAGLDLYGPEVRETPAAGGGRKTFRYRLVPRQPGRLPLDSLFQLVVFNPRTARYDTLRPRLRPNVQGAAPAPAPPPLRPEDDPFYGPALAGADQTLQPLNVYGDVRRYASWLLGGLLVLAVAGVVRGRRA